MSFWDVFSKRKFRFITMRDRMALSLFIHSQYLQGTCYLDLSGKAEWNCQCASCVLVAQGCISQRIFHRTLTSTAISFCSHTQFSKVIATGFCMQKFVAIWCMWSNNCKVKFSSKLNYQQNVVSEIGPVCNICTLIDHPFTFVAKFVQLQTFWY